MRTDQARPVRLADYQPPDWLVDTVELDFALDPTATRVKATLMLKPNPARPAGAPITLDGDGINLVSLSIDGEPLPADHFDATPDRLTITQAPPRPLKLTIETRVDPAANTQLSGLYRSRTTYCTQCEAEGFRRITYFPDRPDVMAIYTTRIEADRAAVPVLLSNGNLIDQGDLANGRHFAVWHDPFPKPSYLFALVGGTLGCVTDTFKTLSGRNVTLKIYVEPGNEDRCAYAMDSLKRAMRWDEDAFGREYDLDVFMIVAVSDFNMGAMENKGLNVFNDKYVLASSETATDADFAHIEAIIAHEYFHNWTGNRITCRDWFQLCLKEGLTVFRDQEFTSDQRSRPVKRISDVRLLRAHQFVEDSGPLAHPVRPEVYHEINNFYTATVYEKGAEVIRMLKVLLGAEAFRTGMDLYFERHDGEACTIEQFIQCFADTSKRDLSQFMLWYRQSGTPDVVAKGTWDAAAKTYRLDLEQTLAPTPGQPTKEPMVIPLALGLVGADGRDMPLSDLPLGGDRQVVVLTKPAETVTFKHIPQRPVLSLNRGFSAPIKLTANISDDDLGFLAAHDSDPFSRWQSVYALAMRILTVQGGGKIAPEHLYRAYETILADTRLEPAFVAQALALPGEADIAREIGHDVDPDAIYAARHALRAGVGARLADALSAARDGHAVVGAYSPDAASAGRRSLRNAALDLLCATGSPRFIAIAAEQYRDADNMTDRMAALSILSLHPTPERTDAIADFYARYSADHLLIDKWFALQAAIPETATLEKVGTLTSHPLYTIKNPNRVRALIGTFAQANPTQFNRPDGAGYDFVAEAVMTLDDINAQVAARLVGAFRSWRVLEPDRRALAEAALTRIAAKSNLSADVADIVRRSLAAKTD
jgi:aminopeptidase N